MCAEGGTGYYHSVTMGRSRNVFGPYEPDPNGPLVTSCPGDFNERADWDHLKPRYYNPDSFLRITCGDRLLHRHTADFDYFCLRNEDS